MVDDENIVILGGGYGGLRSALSLAAHIGPRFRPRITLVDSNSFHQLVTLWHEVAAANLQPADITIPFSRLLDFRKIAFQQATVTGFDFPSKTVYTTGGELRYNTLIIALGSQPNYFGIESLEKYSISIGSLEQAKNIRDTIRARFEEARNLPLGEARRASLLTFVIGGGGFTGTELSGQIADWLPELALNYGVSAGEVNLIIVEGSDHLLKGFDPQLVIVAENVFRKKGVHLKLGQPVAEANDESVVLKSGENISTKTIVWTGGVSANRIVSNSGLKIGAGQRAVVNPFSESIDFEKVYLIGDNALVVDPRSNRPLAPSAQLAVQQGQYVATSIFREALGVGRKPYTPHISAEVVSLGRRSAVAYLFGLRLNGLEAAVLKQLTMVRYAYSIGGLALAFEKARVLLAPGRWFRKGTRKTQYGKKVEESRE